jgi:hypothetical protein
VTLAQGYLFAAPLPAAELEAWLSAPAVGTSSGALGLHGDGRRDHSVLFYDDDDELLRELTAYVSDGLAGNGRSIVIATAAHREALMAALPSRLLLPAEVEGRFLTLDAGQTLSLFMRDGHPDADLFAQTVGTQVRANVTETGTLSAYGEMVAVLWRAGNFVGALQLEELWNDLQRSTPFALLCAYPRVDVDGQLGDAMGQICGLHSLAAGPPASFGGRP